MAKTIQTKRPSLQHTNTESDHGEFYLGDESNHLSNVSVCHNMLLSLTVSVTLLVTLLLTQHVTLLLTQHVTVLLIVR